MADTRLVVQLRVACYDYVSVHVASQKAGLRAMGWPEAQSTRRFCGLGWPKSECKGRVVALSGLSGLKHMKNVAAALRGRKKILQAKY